MPRATRNAAVTKGGVYHVIARGNNRMRIFHRQEDYLAYLEVLDAVARHCRIDIFHYVLMPNHVHILLRSDGNLPAFMQVVQVTYAKRYCKRNKHAGHVWQGRYKSLPVTSDPYLFAAGNYIEMNPVRAHLTAKPEDWPHSSYEVYASGKYNRIVTIDPFYPSIAANPALRQRRYRELVSKTRAKR